MACRGGPLCPPSFCGAGFPTCTCGVAASVRAGQQTCTVRPNIISNLDSLQSAPPRTPHENHYPHRTTSTPAAQGSSGDPQFPHEAPATAAQAVSPFPPPDKRAAAGKTHGTPEPVVPPPEMPDPPAESSTPPTWTSSSSKDTNSVVTRSRTAMPGARRPRSSSERSSTTGTPFSSYSLVRSSGVSRIRSARRGRSPRPGWLGTSARAAAAVRCLMSDTRILITSGRTSSRRVQTSRQSGT